MAKLKPVVILSLCILLSLIVYFVYKPAEPLQQNSSSVFGRNIYSQSSQIGTLADPNYTLTLPFDHRSHDDFDIEWWYLTANLNDSEGNIYGLQWTLFRFRNPDNNETSAQAKPSAWHNNQMFMAHASVHSLEQHWFSEKFARGGVGNASVSPDPFTLAIDDWIWRSTNKSANLLPASLSFTASNKIDQSSMLRANIKMVQSGPFVLHGNNGFSVKSSTNHASHYYSAPFIDISGTLVVSESDAQPRKIEVKGNAWFDQEWTSQLLDANTLGWDWFSLHLDDGSKLMAFRMRLVDQDDYITGSYIDKEGNQTTLEPGSIELEPLSTTTVLGKDLPLKWHANIAHRGIDIVITSIKDNQYNEASVPYYEGMVRVSGSHQGKGFIELSGY